jgi:hypothetical protein
VAQWIKELTYKVAKKEIKNMPTDVRLDDVDGSFVVVQSRVLKVEASDFMLDSPDRHTGSPGNRRALVHDQSDGLTINFNGDYPGGVAINGKLISLNGPVGARISMDHTGTIGAPTGTVDQVTIHATVIHLDTLQADGNSAGDVRITYQHPGDVDQDGNQHTPDFPETVSFGALLKQLQDDISLLKSRVTQLEGKP